MQIEHRASIRKRTSGSLAFNCNLTYSKRWKTRDLRLNDALVEADRADLPLGATGEALIALQGRRQHDLCRLPADVFRLDRNTMRFISAITTVGFIPRWRISSAPVDRHECS